MAFPAKLRSIGSVLGALAAICGAAMPVTTAAREPARVQLQRPRRVVSVNLCADQLLLALADRGQIAGLSRYAGDAEMSAAAPRTRGMRIMRGSAEELMAIAPDLIVGMPARRSPAVSVLKGRGHRLLDLKTPDSYEAIRGSIRQVAAAVGHSERGTALVAQMDRDMARLPKVHRPLVAAYYQRRGYMTGTGTLIDDLMRRMGLTNLARVLGRPALSQISLEELVAARPDLLIVETGSLEVVDEGTALMQHPVLRDIPRVAIPQAWTVCGGPAYVNAARALAQGVRAR
jgi:iron complex transport system substrate-binding protein